MRRWWTIAASVTRIRMGIVSLYTTTRLPSRDLSPNLPDLVDVVNTIGRLWVLGFDVEVEMATERGRGESLTTEWAFLVLGRAQGAPRCAVAGVAAVVW